MLNIFERSKMFAEIGRRRGKNVWRKLPKTGKSASGERFNESAQKCLAETEKLKGERGGGGPPKLESSMATYEMLSSFTTGFFVLARQAAYMSHIENGFEQN